MENEKYKKNHRWCESVHFKACIHSSYAKRHKDDWWTNKGHVLRHTWALLTWMRNASRCDSNENYCAFQQLLVTGTPSRTHLNGDKHINKLNICWCKSNIETKKSSVSRNNWCQTSVLYIVFVRSAVWWLVCVKLYDEYTFKYWTLYTKTT